MKTLEHPDKFVNRHIGPNDDELKEMAEFCGADSVEDLIDQTVPKHIRMEKDLNLDTAITEYQLIEKLRKIAAKNKVYKSYIGMGYHPTILPPVIQRNLLENPGWYTQYTPYQAEIAQGRLEALLNFQTAVIDLTGMEIANASLLDEATAAAEAMIMFYNLRKGDKKNSNTFFVSEECYPQTLDVIKTRAESLGIDLRIGNYKELKFTDDLFGVLVQYPAGYGEIRDYKKFFEEAEKNNVKKVVTSDLLSLTLLTPPGEFGADVVVGSSQRFGVPMGYGGPHAAFFATKDEYKRNIPGRIIGVSVDAEGNNAFRMALQTREQHIRREKATSNICTAQVLLAIIAGMYAVYHGPEGLKKIGERIFNLTHILAKAFIELGYKQLNEDYFDTLQFDISGTDIKIDDIKNETLKNEINIRFIDDKRFGISINEVTTIEDIKELVEIFSIVSGKPISDEKLNDIINNTEFKIYPDSIRQSRYLEHPVFNTYQSETELLRYMKSLENKDLSLVHSMIPLGSCTMKLNATSEMAAITWSEFADLHPFISTDQAEGYKQIINELENDLAEITGFDGVSLQPNSGAQGEYTGLMVIRAYHHERGDYNRNIVLIPSSAHGTNPASAVMAGMKVVVVNCDKHGNIDADDLKKRAEEHSENLSALMITYPSTHGVFEANVKEICEIIHQNGGQVYMDGANMNAQVGYTSPSIIGADVCHLNLHKTFCIPHGGGGPGMGPIAVASHLTKFLPAHPIVDIKKENSISAVSAAPWGSANILLISYSYIKLMGVNGLKKATLAAIINANYLKCKLSPHYKVLYSGITGRIAHELIFDMREFKTSAQIEVEDIAKRLMDYGYHAPTVSFPVPGTLMVEPTESESKDELDRFIEVMISIRKEIEEIENGTLDAVDNPLKNAPHTATMVISDDWQHSYSRERAAFPAEWTRKNKFWPAVARVDSAYGDRNLVCSCLPLEDYAEQEV